MGKRGISPLIATVLIIGFTVALGAVIFVWGGGFIRSLQQGAEATEEKASTCAAATIQMTDVEQSAPNRLKFLLENTGQSDVKSVIVRVTGDKSTTSTTKAGIASAGKKAYQTEFNPETVGAIQKLGVIPTIEVQKKSHPCAPGIEIEAETPTETLEEWKTACGNSAIDTWEECDGTLLNDQTCQTLGYTEGTLNCNSYCTFDVTACTGGIATCGNQAIDTGEECDLDENYSPLLPENTTCEALGYTTGTLTCTDQCKIDTTQCTQEAPQQPVTCGNNIKDGTEECDGVDFGTDTCQTKGYSIGTLKCSADCKTDTTDCSNFKEVSLIDTNICALTESGYAYCWTGTYPTSAKVKKVAWLQDATQISLGGYGFFALTSPGEVYFDGSLFSIAPMMSTPLKISVGWQDVCAVNADGMYCWGTNSRGEVGDGTKTARSTPTLNLMASPSEMITINSGGKYSYYGDHACAIDTAGKLFCWGEGGNGQVGDGQWKTQTLPSEIKQVQISQTELRPAGTWLQVAAGERHACAISSDKTAFCWGRANYGQLGNTVIKDIYGKNPPTAWSIPIKVDALTDVAQIASGGDRSCALTSAGEVYCWGLLIGNSPVKLRIGGTPITGAKQVAIASSYVCALKPEGLYCGLQNGGDTLLAMNQALCGNNVIEKDKEMCDGTALDGKTCQTQGFTGGTLSCKADCSAFDLTTCTGGCGNNAKEGTEECDVNDFGGKTCEDFGKSPDGILNCNPDCTIDSTCTPLIG